MRAVAIGRGGGKLAPADEALVKGLDGPRRLGDFGGAEPIGRSGAEIEQGPRAGEERGDAVSEVHEGRRITRRGRLSWPSSQGSAGRRGSPPAGAPRRRFGYR